MVAAHNPTFAAVPQIPQSETLLSLVLMADREQAIPLSKYASSYSQSRHVSIATAFNSPEYVLNAITDGEQCDLYLTSYPGITEILKSRGLIDVYATTKIRKERLVLVATRGWWKSIAPAKWPKIIRHQTNLPALLRAVGDARLLIGEPTRVASGRYAADILQKQRWQVPLASRIMYATSTAATLQRLIQPGMIGILYTSDVELQPELEIISEIHPSISPEIWLEGNVVAGERMVEARKLLDHLQNETHSSSVKK